MKTTKTFGRLVLVLAMTIGTIAKFKPELFLQIPKVGYIPWALTGGPMPPMLNPSVWSKENSEQFLTKGDIVVASGAKAGTMWLLTIMNLLRSKGDDSYTAITDTVSFVEMMEYPGQTAAESITNELERKRNNPAMRPWFWMGHASAKDGPGMNPRENPDIKYVLIVRNGKEVIRSFHTFCNSINQDFKNMWGGFPPSFSSPREAFQMFAIDVPQFFFEYTRDWWHFRNDKNVLMLHFADLKNDLNGSVRKLAKFLEFEISEDIFKLVVQKADFKYMKEHHQDKIRLCKSRWPGTNRTLCFHDDDGSHLKKGETGGTNKFFSRSMNDEWAELVEKHFGSLPGLSEWAENGGDF